MATLYITEFDHINYAYQAPQTPPLVEQDIAIGSGSLQSAAFGANTRFVMVNTDTACCLAWGANPTAVVTAQRMSAGETRFYGVAPGQKLAVIAASS